MNLKELLTPELFEQVQSAIDEQNANEADKSKHIRFADLSEGKYVSIEKFNSKVNGLNQQVDDLQGQITQRNTDMEKLKTKLDEAKADAGKLVEAQTALEDLQTQYTNAQNEWDAKIKKQVYDFMVRERANDLKFSSNAAKRDFIREISSKELKVDGDVLLGYEDFVTKYKADNPGALVEEDPNPEDGQQKKQPKIVLPKDQPSTDEKASFGFSFHGIRPKPEN